MNTIKTKLFTLRPFKDADVESLVGNINNEKIYRPTLNIPYPYTEKDAKDWIEKNKQFSKENPVKAVNFAIDIDGDVAGGIGITKIENREGELGYWLGEDYWGKGIMSEAVTEVVRYGFETLSLNRIYADVFTFNKASAKVLTKNGFEFERDEIARKDGKEIKEHRFTKSAD